MPKKKAPSTKHSGPDPKKKKTSTKENDEEFSCWLFKSEPESRIEKGVDMKFSFEDLENEPEGTGCWDGVRNYQARNFMRDKMRCGHQGFFYHSNCKPPGIVGTLEVVKEGYVDHTQFDSKDAHYDSAASKSKPKWYMVDVKAVKPLKRFVPLSELKELHLKHKAEGGPLAQLSLFTSARLSVQPIRRSEWDFILELAETD